MLRIPEFHVPLRVRTRMVAKYIQNVRVDRHFEPSTRRHIVWKMPDIRCPRARAEICPVPAHVRECVADIQFNP